MPTAYGTVHALLLDFVGDPAEGWVTFAPRITQVNVPGDVIYVPEEVSVKVDAGLVPPTELIASNQPGGEPDSFQWTATFNMRGALHNPLPQTYTLLAGQTLDLSSIISEIPAPGTVHVIDLEATQGPPGPVGPQGPAGPQGPQGEQGPDELPAQDGADGKYLTTDGTTPSWVDGVASVDGLIGVVSTDTTTAIRVPDTGTATGAALAATLAVAGEPASALGVALPQLNAAIRDYNDATRPTLRIIGLGSSIGNGPTLPDPATQSPVNVFAEYLKAAVNQLGNMTFSVTNGSGNASVITDAWASGHYTNAKTAAGGTPTVVLICYGMNDGQPNQYHQGQTYPGAYSAMKTLLSTIIADRGDPIVVTSPHPHSVRNPWATGFPVGSTPYPSGTLPPVPNITPAASVVMGDWAQTGELVPASYRHIRINETMRQAAVELGVPVIDAEKYWFKAIATYGEDALFAPNEYVHPNLLGHQQSYSLAFRDFARSLVRPTIRSGTALATGRVENRVKVSNSTRTSTTLVADTQMAITVGAGEQWEITADLYYTGFTDTDLMVGLVTPASTTGRIAVSGVGTTATGAAGDVSTWRSVPVGSALPVGCNQADAYARFKANVTSGGTGTIGLTYAQATGTANAVTVYARSSMQARRVN